jgi:hypothetical protein
MKRKKESDSKEVAKRSPNWQRYNKQKQNSIVIEDEEDELFFSERSMSQDQKNR